MVSSLLKPYLCSFCQDTNVQIRDSEILCATCGYVHGDQTEWVHDFENKANFTLKKKTQDLSSSINSYKDYGGKSVDYMVASSLKRTLQRTRSTTTYDRTKVKGLFQIDRLVKSLNLSQDTENRITDKFIDFNRKGFLKSKNVYSCVAALVLLICNDTNIPISMSQILKSTVVSKKKINSDFFYLYHLFEQAGPLSAATKKHYEKYLSYIKVSWPKQEQFYKNLDKITQMLDLFGKCGREGIVNSATIIYMLLKYYQYPNCENVLGLIMVNRLTIKNCWTNLKLTYPELEGYDVT